MSAAALVRVRLLAANGRLGEALAALDILLAEAPDHVGALILKGGLLLDEGEAEKSLLLCERAAVLAPRSAEVVNALARCLHALARDEEALEAAERARRLLPEADNGTFAAPVYLTLVWCLRELRRYREALAAAEEGLARTPDAILAQWASTVEEELAEAQRDEC